MAARTATVNPKRKKRRSSSGGTKKRRRRSTSGSARGRRRRRNPAPARRRRRTTGSASGRRRRRRSSPRKNPRDIMDFNYTLEMGPPATLGVVGARWATKQAGPFETPEGGGTPQPGLTHAIWLYLMSRIGGNMVGNFFGDQSKGDAFEIAALGFAGDLFLRHNFFTDADSWYRRNVYLGDGSPYRRMMSGVGRSPYAMGQTGQRTYTDATGQQYVKTAHGWRLAGVGRAPLGPVASPQVAPGMGGFSMSSPLGGFSMSSPLGQGNSGGYLETGRGYDSGNKQRTDPIQHLYGGSSFGY